MSYKEELQFWLEDSYFDEETKQELRAIQDNEAEAEDRFYKELEFGTDVSRICGRGGSVYGSKRYQGVCVRILTSHTGTFVCTSEAGLYFRYRGNSQP